MNNVVTTLAPSFLIGSSSILLATRKPIISQMGLKFSRIRPGTYELPALERLVCLFVFVALRTKSTAMVIAGRSVHLTTLFPGQA